MRLREIEEGREVMLQIVEWSDGNQRYYEYDSELENSSDLQNAS